MSPDDECGLCDMARAEHKEQPGRTCENFREPAPTTAPEPLVIKTARGWRCLDPGCPEREPIRASAPPTCYTCGQAMAEVQRPVNLAELAALRSSPMQPIMVDADDFPLFGPSALSNGSRVPYTDASIDKIADEVRKSQWQGNAPGGYGAPSEQVIRDIQRGLALDDARMRGERVHKEIETYLRHGVISLHHAIAPVEPDLGRHWRAPNFVRSVFPVHVALVDKHPDPHCRISDLVTTRIDVAPAPDRAGWRCTRAGCPDRAPVYAAAAPTCYTCAQPMARVEFGRPPMLVSGVPELIETMQSRLMTASMVPPHVLRGGMKSYDPKNIEITFCGQKMTGFLDGGFFDRSVPLFGRKAAEPSDQLVELADE